MNETDWFYYIALAIATFVVIYIIYISLQFQNNMMEGFSMGGGAKKDKKDKKKDETKVEKALDAMDDKNTQLEDILKIPENKENYIKLIDSTRRNADLSIMNIVIDSVSNDEVMKTFIPMFAGFRAFREELNDVETFINNE